MLISSIIHFSDKSRDLQIIRNSVGYCAYSKKLEGSLLQKQAKELLDQELFLTERIGQPWRGTRAFSEFLHKGIAGSVEK